MTIPSTIQPPPHHQSRDAYSRGYPRPQLQRAGWTSLNGDWEFALDPDHLWRTPSEVRWSGSIRVPFAPETTASGIEVTSFFEACWYRRQATVPAVPEGGRILLHFGAVDYLAHVWVEGQSVGSHRGGYTPFTFDVTDQLRQTTKPTFEVVVCAVDD